MKMYNSFAFYDIETVKCINIIYIPAWRDHRKQPTIITYTLLVVVGNEKLL